MNYEKAYKEALNRAKLLKDNPKKVLFECENIPVSDYIFPELKEPNDEKIRKELIDAIQGLWDDDALPMPLSLKRKNAWLTWLEKQGNKDSQVTIPTFTFDDVLALQCCMETVKKVQEDNELYEQLQSLHDRLHDAYWLEKQVEQKPTDKIQLGKEYKCIDSPRYSTFMRGNIYKPEDEFLCSLMNLCSDCFELVKDGEQNDFTSNAKKFKVDDWITDGNSVLHITNMDYGFYQFEDSYDTISIIDEKYHLWTIEDAKPGDVLVCPKYANDTIPNIFIFKDIDRKDNDVYCYCSFLKVFAIGGYIASADPIDTDFCPATKEQCDILFQKMNDAAWEWDAEKKELKSHYKCIVTKDSRKGLEMTT